PDNCVLTVVGDFVTTEARELIARYFGDIGPGRSFPLFNRRRKPRGAEQREGFLAPVQLPRIYRLYHLPKMGERDWVYGDLLSTVLTSDKASRLERALVYEKQIATDVAAYVLPTEATGMLLLQATANEDVPVEEIEKAIDEELERIVVNGITEDELTRAKN